MAIYIGTNNIYSCTVLLQTHRCKLGTKATGRIAHETSQNSFAHGGLGTESVGECSWGTRAAKIKRKGWRPVTHPGGFLKLLM